MNQDEAELALHRLLDKHQAWLIQQPELLLLWTADRNTRRRAAKALADELLTIPVRAMTETTPPNRALRRRILAELERNNPRWWGGVEA